ncbi:hypothetical protein BDQ17DRAFT_112020 [Cyathus striatus]|nr:hypothetical protein BDQ17DRAFT_112020 [Cyathus striatus]
MEELYLNINRHPSTLPWLLHPKCPIQYSTIQRLRLAQFMHYEDKVAELLAKSSVSVGAVEFILYDCPELPYTPLSFYAPSVLHTLILHLPFLASEGMSALDWIKSTLSTIPSSNVIQNVALNMHAANDDAEFGITTQQETKARWVEFGDYLFEPARFPKLKKKIVHPRSLKRPQRIILELLLDI